MLPSMPRNKGLKPLAFIAILIRVFERNFRLRNGQNKLIECVRQIGFEINESQEIDDRIGNDHVLNEAL